MAQLTDYVEAHMSEATYKQTLCYDQHASPCSFKAGDAVWLASPTAGKLDPKLEGNCKVYIRILFLMEDEQICTCQQATALDETYHDSYYPRV